jgi:HD-GYP domain-containing protein (c-di-GMP phosphodiesterase class II)
MDTQNTVIVAVALAILGGFWALFRIFKRREVALKSALETTQRKIDAQASKLHILTRGLPNLNMLLSSNHSSEGWKTLFLDDGRALARADGGSYWVFHESEQTLELEGARGTETGMRLGTKVPIEGSELAEAIKKRQSLIVANKILATPILIDGNVVGVCRFTRNEGDDFLPADVAMLETFSKQLSLSLDNRSMIANREKFYLELVQALADTLDARDASTEGHTRRARSLARGIGKEMALPEEFIYYLEFAALMHDIGNIAIDEQLLKKPGKLTAEEFNLVKKHPEFGYKILAPVSVLAPVAPMVLYHQEWFNGKGYPEGLSGEEIPLGARIVAVLDAWGAMTSHRPWRRALEKDEAIKEIRKGAGTQFDPKVVDAFLATIQHHGVGA